MKNIKWLENLSKVPIDLLDELHKTCRTSSMGLVTRVAWDSSHELHATRPTSCLEHRKLEIK